MKRLALDKGESPVQLGRPFNWNILAEMLKPQTDPEKQVKVIIMRMKSKEHFAIIGPLHVKFSDDLSLEYFLFPYVEE